MNNSNVIGIDLAKNVIQICKVSINGEIIFNKPVSPKKLKEILINERAAVVAMEGCGSCHYWARFSKEQGHDTRIISPKKVKAFLQGHKTDANDALAIAMASVQFGMIFSQIKSIEQQSLQTLEKSRQFLSKEITALGNHIRAYLYEYGITMKTGRKSLAANIVLILDRADERLPVSLKPSLRILWERYKASVEQLKALELSKADYVKQLEPCKRLLKLEGVGQVCASMLYASLGNGKGFKNGRHASVYIGLTPKQYSSGGKTCMMGINKQGGNKTLRAALFQGAFSVIHKLPDEAKTVKQVWLKQLVARVGVKRACIALANKTVRTAWALLASGKAYKPAPLVL